MFIEVKRSRSSDNIAQFSVLMNPVLHTLLMEDTYLIPSNETDLKNQELMFFNKKTSLEVSKA